MAENPRPWFQPKHYGYGAGLPVSWQGWSALVLFVMGLIVACTMLHGTWRVVAISALVVTLIEVAGRKTEGGWRWRWGCGK
jgi:hypothetical protein